MENPSKKKAGHENQVFFQRMLSDSRILIAKKQAVIMLIGILMGALAESLPRGLNVRDWKNPSGTAR
jgi:hypothetical protein